MPYTRALIFLAKPAQQTLANQVCDFLRQNGCEAQINTSLENFNAWDKTDLLISLGGDGTLLKCVRYAAPKQIPVFGINCGTLGFLAACEKEDFLPALTQLLQGKCDVRKRKMLEVRVFTQRQPPQLFNAFNDCVLRSAAARTLLVSATWNTTELSPYYGDGVIVSTPTGSTAYSLASGGPIVEPSVSVLVVTPISPHSLHQRPLVLPVEGKLTLTPVLKYDEDRALISLDGQTNLTLSQGDTAEISCAPYPALLICPPDRTFFQVLNRKLNWGKPC